MGGLALAYNISQLVILNRAFDKIGSDRISSLTEGSKQSIIGAHAYPGLLRELLEAHPWNFATDQVALAQLSTNPFWEYTYAFQKPADCIRVIKTDLNDNVPWKEMGEYIVTDNATLGIEYIKLVEDAQKFPHHFTAAFVARLAQEFAYTFTQKTSLVELMEAEYGKKLAYARSFDAQASRADMIKARTWAAIRR